MSLSYKSILLATDATNSHDALCDVYDAALDMAELSEATLSHIHTIPRIGESGVEYALPSMAEIEAEMKRDAKRELRALDAEMGLKKGSIATKIFAGNLHDAVKTQQGIDLAVIINDNDHMWGSTAEAVLQQANCDILAVKSM